VKYVGNLEGMEEVPLLCTGVTIANKFKTEII